MRRKIAIFAIGFFLLPSIVSAVSTDPRMAIRSDASVMVKLDPKGNIKDFFTRAIDKLIENSDDASEPAEARLKKLIKTGHPLFFWVADDLEGTYASMAATQEDFDVLKTNGTAESYNGVEIAIIVGDGVYAFFLDNRLYVAAAEEITEKTAEFIDLVKGKSGTPILQNPAYTELLKYAISDSDLEIFLDGSLFQKIFGAYGAEAGLVASPSIFVASSELQNLDDFLRGILLSLKETSAGYKFSGAITSDDDFLKKYNVSLIPGGTFTPSLHKKFPAGKPIYYQEGNDLKEQYENEKRLHVALGANTTDLEGVMLNSYVQMAKDEFGIDITPLIDTLNKRYAVAIQDDENMIYPVVTILADVSMNAAEAEKVVADLVDAFVAATREEDSDIAIKVEETEIANGTFKKLTIQPEEFDEDFRAMDPDPIVIFAGVTADNTLVVTNHPQIKETYGTGISEGAIGIDINEGPIGSIATINIRNLIHYLNRGITWWITAASPANRMLEFDDLQAYFTFVSSIYAAREFTAVTKSAGENSASFEGMLAIDKAEAPSYDAFLENIKQADSDGDGLFDYEEIYKYHLNPREADSDEDGRSDQMELSEGTDPYGVAGTLSDVEEDQWYVKEVGPLYQQGIIRGYEDKTFKPHKRVTRAEFTCMVQRAFQDGDFEELIQPGSYGYSSSDYFQDVSKNDWFQTCVIEAWRLGYVEGDSKTTNNFRHNFRPSDTITRAETAAILERVMVKNIPINTEFTPKPADDKLPFTDVKDDDWFRPAISFGYTNGVIKGRSADTFDPHGLLTRAEAAAMIRRMMEARFELLENVQPEKLPLEDSVEVLEKLF